MKDFDESVIGRLRAQEREIERLKVKEKVTEATIDHGSLTGLGDNDHPQYLLAATGKAADSDKLDGIDSTGFSLADGWNPDSDTWTYVSATSFKITGKDVRSRFPVGTKIKLTQTTVKYFYVVATAYSTDTTVTITRGSDYSLADAAITSPHYSYAETPQGFPGYFNYTPTVTYDGGTTNPTSITTNFKFAINGRTVTVHGTGSLTRGSGDRIATLFTLPVNNTLTCGVAVGLYYAATINWMYTYTSPTTITIAHSSMNADGQYFITSTYSI